MYNHQWSFQGNVQEIIDGRTLKIATDLGFNTWKIVPIKFNRLRISLPNDNLCYFLKDFLQDKEIYFTTIRNKDRYGWEKFFAEIYVDSKNFPEETLSLRDINRKLATGLKSASNQAGGLINLNDFLVKQGFAEYVDQISLRYGSQ